MTAALELAPELRAAIDAAVEAKVQAHLTLVPEGPKRPLSMLPASVRRRECARRKAAEARRSEEIDRCDRSLSTKPESVRRRKSEQKKATRRAIAAIDRRALDLQPVNTERATAGGVLRTDRTPTGEHGAAPPVRSGPLAGDVAGLVDRVSGYAESNSKRDRVWLYREAGRIFREELGLRLPEPWSGPKDWGAAKALVREYKPEEIVDAIKATCGSWKLSPTWSRPTLGLVLYQLRQARPAAAPAARADPRRLSGEQLEERDRARARRQPALDLSPGVKVLDHSATANETPPLSTAGLVPAPPTPARGPLQLAEPSATSSAEAQAVLELVNATAARCRAFRGRP